MSFVRKGLLAIITPLLVVLLFAMALDFGVLRVAGSPAPIEHLLADSGIYNGAVNSALDQAQTSAGSSNAVALNNQIIKSAAQSTFTPRVVQQSTEQVLGGVYDWLNGKTPQPDFNIDLTSTKSDFAQKVGQAAQQRAASLPVCKSVPAVADPLNATCIPPGVTPSQIGEQAKNDVLNAQGFLDHPVITSDSVKKSGTNQPVFTTAKLQNAPKQFQRAKKTPFLLVVLIILFVIAIIFLSSSRRKGLRRVGLTLVFAGVFLLAFAWAFASVSNHKIIPKIQLDNKVLQGDIQKLAGDLTQKVDQNSQVFGEVYAALGVLAVGAMMIVGRGGNKPKAANQKNSGGPEPPKSPPYKTPQRPRQAPPKIQG